MEKSHFTKWDLTCVEVRSHLGGMSTPPCWKTLEGKVKALGNAPVYNTSITACKSNVNLTNKKLEKKTQTAKNSYKLPPNDLFYLKKKWCVAPEICRFLYFCIFYICNFKNLWRHHRYCRQQCCPLWKVYFWLPDNFFYLVLRDFFSLFVSQ